MSEFTYSVDSFEEQWYPNGDGYIRIVIKLKEITPTNVVYLKSKHVKSLPIPEKLKSIIPHHFLLMKEGYYLFFSLSEYDKRDYKLLIINMKDNEIILRYEIM